MNTLLDFGWSEERQREWEEMGFLGMRPARVVADFGTSLKIATPAIVTAELSGKLAHYTDRQLVPKVGDWVAVHIPDNGNAVIETVILRRGEIARKAAGKQTVKQILATNIDIAFVLLALDNDFSIERLKRYLYQLSINAIQTVIVLNKADKTDDVASYTAQLQKLGLPIVVATAIKGSGVDEIAAHIAPGHTAILLGSSGVGKSTLTNKLLGRDIQQTSETRVSDDTGKHTTVHRELFILPNGGLLIDTPGIRELQLWGTEAELDNTYDDIVSLVSQCKYKSCKHRDEQGCAIRRALQNGSLSKTHYANYVKMKAELAGLAKKNEAQRSEGGRKIQKHTERRRRDVWHDEE